MRVLGNWFVPLTNQLRIGVMGKSILCIARLVTKEPITRDLIKLNTPNSL